MALSTTELEQQSAEYLPSREVMTSLGGNDLVNTVTRDVNYVLNAAVANVNSRLPY